MSKIVKFRMGKGRTFRPTEEEEWTRKYLELEVELPEKHTEEDFHEALLRSEYLIDNWIGQPEVPQIPQLDPARIEKLVWTRYSDRTRAQKPDEAAWTFSDPSRHGPEDEDVVKELVKAIKACKDGKLRIGSVEFSLSGSEKQFISRRPLKV